MDDKTSGVDAHMQSQADEIMRLRARLDDATGINREYAPAPVTFTVSPT